jgi:hypothetical protein
LHIDINEWLGSTMLVDIEKYRKAGATDSEIRNAFNQAMSR